MSKWTTNVIFDLRVVLLVFDKDFYEHPHREFLKKFLFLIWIFYNGSVGVGFAYRGIEIFEFCNISNLFK